MKLFKEITFAAALSLAAVFTLADAQAHEVKIGDLVINHPWSRQSPMSASVAAGFLTITNNGKQDDRLVKASSEISPMVQIHDMTMQGDVMETRGEGPGGRLILGEQVTGRGNLRPFRVRAVPVQILHARH